MEERQSDVLVLGAGIAGLTAGYYAKKKGLSVRILEKENRVGGVIHSERKEGYLLEHGPNTVTPNESLWELIDALSLTDQVLLAPANVPRYVCLNKKLIRVPLSPLAFLKSPLFSLAGKIRFFREPFVSKGQDEDETLSEFIERRFGSNFLEHLLKPFVNGVWAGDADRLSAASCFPQLKKWEEENGSVLKGAFSQRKMKNGSATKNTRKGLLSFKNGLSALPEALAAQLKSEIELNQPVTKIQFNKSQPQAPWVIGTETSSYRAKEIVVTLAAPSAANIFSSFSAAIAQTLKSIPYAPLIALHLTLPKRHVVHDLNGYGFLMAPKENKNILGCLWSSSLFPNRTPAEEVLLTMFMGGARQPDLINAPETRLLDLAYNDLSETMHLSSTPRVLSMRKHAAAIPQYNVGHAEREKELKSFEEIYTGLHFSGNSMGGISVGDVVKNAKKLFAN